MNDRFAPEWSPYVRQAWAKMHEALAGADYLLVDAFAAIEGSATQVKSAAAVQSEIKTVVEMGMGAPWQLFDTLSELISRAPSGLAKRLEDTIRIPNGRPNERLKPTANGNWQLAWELTSDSNVDMEDREVAIEWYRARDIANAPLVPVSIIDCIASCVLLLQQDLVIPAASVLSIALEATLWDALLAKKIERCTEYFTYAPVQWKVKKAMNRLSVLVEGADHRIQDMPLIPLEEIVLQIRRSQAGDNATAARLSIDAVDIKLLDFLASNRVLDKGLRTDKGLSEALQRGRSTGLKCLESVPKVLDTTLIRLRNSLIHLPSQGKLDEPIPIPGKGELLTVEELKNNPRFVRNMLPLIVQIVNSAYAGDDQDEPAPSGI